MNATQIKKALNKTVIFQGHEYIFTGAIFRKNEKEEYFYQAELLDTNGVEVTQHGYTYKSKSLLIAKLEEIEFV